MKLFKLLKVYQFSQFIFSFFSQKNFNKDYTTIDSIVSKFQHFFYLDDCHSSGRRNSLNAAANFEVPLSAVAGSRNNKNCSFISGLVALYEEVVAAYPVIKYSLIASFLSLSSFLTVRMIHKTFQGLVFLFSCSLFGAQGDLEFRC